MEELSVLLAATRTGRDVLLRVDAGGWSGRSCEELPVLTLHLHEVSLEEPSGTINLEMAVGLECEVEEFPTTEGLTEVLLFSNYHVDSLRFVCENTTYFRSAYESADLLSKVTWLARLYSESVERNEILVARSHRLRTSLEAGLGNLLARAEKKIDYLAPKGKGASVQGERKAYQSALALLRRLQDESAT